jgi:hypothetical protein
MGEQTEMTSWFVKKPNPMLAHKPSASLALVNCLFFAEEGQQNSEEFLRLFSVTL